MTSVDTKNEAAVLRAATELLRKSDEMVAIDPIVAAGLAREAYQVGRRVRRVAHLVKKESDFRLQKLRESETKRRPLAKEVPDINRHVRVVERVDRNQLPKMQRNMVVSPHLVPASNTGETREWMLRMVIRIMAAFVTVSGTVVTLIQPT